MSAIDRVAERRTRIMLKAIDDRLPRSTRELRRMPEVTLWDDSAYTSTLDGLVASGQLVEDPTGRPIALPADGRLA